MLRHPPSHIANPSTTCTQRRQHVVRRMRCMLGIYYGGHDNRWGPYNRSGEVNAYPVRCSTVYMLKYWSYTVCGSNCDMAMRFSFVASWFSLKSSVRQWGWGPSCYGHQPPAPQPAALRSPFAGQWPAKGDIRVFWHPLIV